MLIFWLKEEIFRSKQSWCLLPNSKHQKQSCYQYSQATISSSKQSCCQCSKQQLSAAEMVPVLPDRNYPQQSCCQWSQTAIISSGDDASSVRQKLSAAELLSVIPNSNYQQQCWCQGSQTATVSSKAVLPNRKSILLILLNFYSVKEQKTQSLSTERKNHRSSSSGFTGTSNGSLVDLYVLKYACLGRRRLYRSQNVQAIYHLISELCWLNMLQLKK